MQILKKVFSIVLRVSISIVLLFFVFRQVDKKMLFAILKEANKGFLCFAFIIFLLGYIICVQRWEMLLKALKVQLSLKRVMMAFAGGVFFNLFLPSTIGGDFMRTLDLATHTKKPREVVAAVFLDRLSGYVGLVLLALCSLVFGWKLLRDRSILLSVGIISAVLVGILSVLFNTWVYSKVNTLFHSPGAHKIFAQIRNLHQELHYFRHQKRVMYANVLLSLIIQSVAPLTFFVVSRAFGLRVPLIYFFIFIPIISAITLLPISIGGLGLRDATTVFFFAKVGVGKDLAFAMSLLNFFFIIVIGALGGLIYVFTVHHRRLQPH